MHRDQRAIKMISAPALARGPLLFKRFIARSSLHLNCLSAFVLQRNAHAHATCNIPQFSDAFQRASPLAQGERSAAAGQLAHFDVSREGVAQLFDVRHDED
jgi:hypothetical protein